MRRRYQKGSVYLNAAKTMWMGSYMLYVDSNGVETRQRQQIPLCPVRDAEGRNVTYRQARKLLQPKLDIANSSTLSGESKTLTFEAFVTIWQRDYLSLTKKSTQSAITGHVNRLKAALDSRGMRSIGVGDIQRIITTMNTEGLDPKTMRNLWGVVSMIWAAALAQKYVDAALSKPKLPRRRRKTPRYFITPDVGKIINASEGENRVFYWLAAETGLRAGELAGLRLVDIGDDRITVNQSVWHGEAQDPKTDNALRTLALSPQLVTLLREQAARQRAKGHKYLFSASTGAPWDMDVYRQRKLTPLLKSLGIKQAGFHAFRHYNVALLADLGVPLTTIKERVAEAAENSTGRTKTHQLRFCLLTEAKKRRIL